MLSKKSQRHTYVLKRHNYLRGWIALGVPVWENVFLVICGDEIRVKQTLRTFLKPLRKINIQLKKGKKEQNVWHFGCYFIVASSAVSEDQQWLIYSENKWGKKDSFQVVEDECTSAANCQWQLLLDLLEAVNEGIRSRWCHHWGLPPVRASQ